MSISVLGSINIDLNLRVERHPLPGETIPGQGGQFTPGGKGANQALAAALAGAKTKMLGAVGEDVNSGAALKLLRENNVDLDGVKTVAGPTGLAVVSVDDAGENSIVVIGGANAAITPEIVDEFKSQILASNVLVMQGEIPRAAIEAAAKIAFDSGVRLVFNLAPAIEVSPAVLLQANPLVVNEHEAARALEILSLPAESEPNRIIEALLEAGVDSVVLTLGGEGAVVGWCEDRSPHLISVPAVPVSVVDTVGAGDAFVGVLAASLDRGSSLSEGAKAASEFAAKTIQFPGAQASYVEAAN